MLESYFQVIRIEEKLIHIIYSLFCKPLIHSVVKGRHVRRNAKWQLADPREQAVSFHIYRLKGLRGLSCRTAGHLFHLAFLATNSSSDLMSILICPHEDSLWFLGLYVPGGCLPSSLCQLPNSPPYLTEE